MLHDFFYGPARKNFTIRTKKIEWLLASGKKKPLEEYIRTQKFDETIPSKCRECKTTLMWGDGTYNFDHYDNDNTNNSQRNCYLACRNCHGKATKVEKRAVRGIFGQVIDYKTIKRKVGYKKPKNKR